MVITVKVNLLLGIRIGMDHKRLANDLACELTSGPLKERVVSRFVYEHHSEVSASGVSADKKALAEIAFEESGVRGRLIRKGCEDGFSSGRRKHREGIPI